MVAGAEAVARPEAVAPPAALARPAVVAVPPRRARGSARERVARRRAASSFTAKTARAARIMRVVACREARGLVAPSSCASRPAPSSKTRRHASPPGLPGAVLLRLQGRTDVRALRVAGRSPGSRAVPVRRAAKALDEASCDATPGCVRAKMLSVRWHASLLCLLRPWRRAADLPPGPVPLSTAVQCPRRDILQRPCGLPGGPTAAAAAGARSWAAAIPARASSVPPVARVPGRAPARPRRPAATRAPIVTRSLSTSPCVTANRSDAAPVSPGAPTVRRPRARACRCVSDRDALLRSAGPRRLVLWQLLRRLRAPDRMRALRGSRSRRQVH